MACLCRARQPSGGSILILHGVNPTCLQQKLEALRREGAAIKSLSPDMSYLPGEAVPFAAQYNDSRERAEKVSELAVRLGGSGMQLLVALPDDPQAVLYGHATAALRRQLPGPGAPHVLSALVYQPPAEASAMPAVWALGTLFAGVAPARARAGPAPDALEVVTRPQLQAACARLRGALARAGEGPDDAARHAAVAEAFLRRAWGLDRTPEVHIVPRHPHHYDVVVNARDPGHAARQLEGRLRAARPGASVVLRPVLVLRDPAVPPYPRGAPLRERLGAGSALLDDLGLDSLQLSGRVHPGDDFDAHVNDNWRQAHPIPADRPSWGAMPSLRDRIVEVCSEATGARPGGVDEDVFAVGRGRAGTRLKRGRGTPSPPSRCRSVPFHMLSAASDCL